VVLGRGSGEREAGRGKRDEGRGTTDEGGSRGKGRDSHYEAVILCEIGLTGRGGWGKMRFCVFVCCQGCFLGNCEMVDKLRKNIDAAEYLYTLHINPLSRLRDALLPKLMKLEIRVEDFNE